MFSVRTSYETSRGESINPNVSTCNPSKLWMIGRHGTRLPNPSDLTSILENKERLHSDILSNYEQGKTSLCASDFELLRNWIFDSDITLERSDEATPAGCWLE